jgi:hypothetical protein
MSTCGSCGVQGHNTRTCFSKVYRFADIEVKLGNISLDVIEICYEVSPPLDSLVDALLRARGYGGIANILEHETGLAAWADRLYELAEVTDCEEVLQLCALAIRDPAHIGRLNKWAAKQLTRDQALRECQPVELVLQRLIDYKE